MKYRKPFWVWGVWDAWIGFWAIWDVINNQSLSDFEKVIDLSKIKNGRKNTLFFFLKYYLTGNCTWFLSIVYRVRSRRSKRQKIYFYFITMSTSIKNLYQFRTTSKITQAQGASSTFTVWNDIFTNSAVSLTAWSIQLTNRTWSQIELFTVTVSAWVATIASRGIKPDGGRQTQSINMNDHVTHCVQLLY